MTIIDQKMAALMGWLEESCGSNQAQSVLDCIKNMLRKDTPLECMEIMLLADLIHGYRKEMLRRIKDYKALCSEEYANPVAIFQVHKDLKRMKEEIANGIVCWADLRTVYFTERADYMARCKWPYSPAVCLSNSSYEQTSPQSA